MKLMIKYDKNEHYNDSKKLLLHEIIHDKPFITFLIIYLIISITHLVNISSHLSIFYNEIKLLAYSLGVGLFAMIVHSTYGFFNKLNKVKKASNFLPKNEEYIKINNDNIELSWNNQVLKYKWELFKKVICIGKTVYIIPLEKSPLIRLNSIEIRDFDYDETLMFLKEKIGNPKRVRFF